MGTWCERGGVQKLSITKQHGLSSLYQPHYAVIEAFEDPENYRIEKTASVPVQTLDALASVHHFTDGMDLLKIDTQGSEYDILCGAPHVLGGTLAVYIEMEFAELYIGQPLFGEIHALMSTQGFYLHDLLRVRRTRRAWKHFSRPQLLYGYGLYVKSAVDNKQAVRLAAVMTMLGYFDKAVSLIPDFYKEIAEHALRHAKNYGLSHARRGKKLYHDRKDERVF
ncbi:MAG: FkbM family methyltransferase [Candidatus Sungbacteria bacterium]|nr:FkbM family methyltransferase [Candidatus Sungbacteria bacterium]